MLGISFKALDVSRERRAAIEAARAIRIQDAAKEAQQHVREDADEWDMVDVEDQDAAPSAPVGSETRKFTNAVEGTAEVDTIDGAEAERIALAAGDDVGDDEARNLVMVQKRISSAEDHPFAKNHQIGAADRPISNRNSLNSSLNVGEIDSRGLSDVGEDARPGTHENSPLGAEVLARLKFLDEEDDEEEGGGVKL